MTCSNQSEIDTSAVRLRRYSNYKSEQELYAEFAMLKANADSSKASKAIAP